MIFYWNKKILTRARVERTFFLQIWRGVFMLSY